MGTIDKHEIEFLLKVEEWPAISMYIPVSRIGDQQDSIRYKNLLIQVENRLIHEGMRTSEACSLLTPEYDLVKNVEYWKNLGQDGLAVFLSGQTVLHYALPVSFNELAMVGRRFHVRPLLPLLAGERYLILALSRNRLQLFQGNCYQVKEIDLPEDTPRSMPEALKYDDPERQLQFHTKTGSVGGQRGAMFHGQGVGIDDKNPNLERYFQAIDRALFPQLENEGMPIVLAGTEELHGVYRDITKSHTILPRGVAGNVGELSAEILHQKAWEIAGEYFSEKEQEAVRDFQDNLGSGSGRGVDNLESVLTAAFDGRVDILFVAENEQVWGIFDPENRQVTVKKQDERKVVNLLDEAVYLTLNTKGTVHVKKNHDMPTDTIICAQLRY
ncbi:MAG: hypothetical protein WBB23_09110 [Desulforhopalus sp.]